MVLATFLKQKNKNLQKTSLVKLSIFVNKACDQMLSNQIDIHSHLLYFVLISDDHLEV